MGPGMAWGETKIKLLHIPFYHSDIVKTSTAAPIISTSTAKFDLSALRNTIRSSDRTQVFRAFDDSTNSNRQPKKDNDNMDIQTLRKITDKSNRDFLLSVFNRVNG